MCLDYVGVPPTIDCGDGVAIPIYVNGEEVTEDQPSGTCDDSDFKGTCHIGSRVGRVEGIDIYGNPMHWITIYIYSFNSTNSRTNMTCTFKI